MTDNRSISSFLQSKDYIQIPLIKNAVGHFAIRAKVNNDSALLILDTGASETCLDAESAKKFDIFLQDSGQGASGYGGESENIQTGKARLTLSNFVIEELPIAVLDLSYVNKAYSAENTEHIDGVIGADILIGHYAVIDYATGTLFLKNNNLHKSNHPH